MKDCTNLVEVLKETVPDVPRDFANVIVNGVSTAASAVSSAIRNYGSVYGQNQMLEYSTDGKINDVTGSFQGRVAISDSVLANLSNELKVLKSNYDKAWQILPQITREETVTITSELSASFELSGETSAPESVFVIDSLDYPDSPNTKEFIFSRRSTGDVLFRMYVPMGNLGAVTFSDHSDPTLTLEQLIRGLPGTLILNDDSTSFSSYTCWAKNAGNDVTLIIFAIGSKATFIIANANSQKILTNTGTQSIMAQQEGWTPIYWFGNQPGAITHLSIPGFIIGSTVMEDQLGQIAYAIPEGPSTITVSKQVSEDVPYTVMYNNIPNESEKIQNLIDAVPS